jgi:thiazolinyl imide reductase
VTRVVVCGTTFGQSYLAAVAALPEFELAGILGSGSERSAKTAARFGVPLWTDIDQAAEVDLACVVVRSSVMGGSGSELARDLLARKIHVVQEQPIHHDDLTESLRVAHQHGARFRMGDLYAQLPAVRSWARAARRVGQKPVYLEASCAVQVSFPLLHVLGEALGTIRPWRVAKVATSGPFTVVTGEIGGVPVVLRVQNEITPEDPDNHMHLLIRATIGFDGGSLALHDAHGPVSWTPRLHIPEAARTSFDFSAAHLDHGTTALSGSCENYREFLETLLPQAIGRDLRALLTERPEQYHLALCQMWRDLTSELGYASILAEAAHCPVPAPGRPANA